MTFPLAKELAYFRAYRSVFGRVPYEATSFSLGTIPILWIVEVIDVGSSCPVNAHPSGGGAGVILVIANRQRWTM